MLLTHFDPEVGLPPRWLTPGGGIDAYESAVDAAVRELYEETGLQTTPEALSGPVWQTSGRWNWADGNFHTYTDTFFQLKVEGFVLDDSGWTNDERRDILEYRWWNVEELALTQDLVGPHGLTDFLLNHRFAS